MIPFRLLMIYSKFSPLARIAVARGRALFRGATFRACGKAGYVYAGTRITNPCRVVAGDSLVLREHVWINCEGDLSKPSFNLGSRVYIGRFCHINAFESVTFEDDVMIADSVHVSDVGHAFEDAAKPISTQGVTPALPVVLESGCWIGKGVVILPGVRVGRNSVVGANAVVTRDVPERSVVAGVPAKVIHQLPRGDTGLAARRLSEERSDAVERT
jgi:acyl-[acyl carrier protein]--UDP-N-acetylglucosamine O-acyltransferase